MKSIVILILCTAVVVQTYDTKDEGVSQPFAVQNRIFQGQPALPGQFPHVAYLSDGCGGSLIDVLWVISAAHCVNPRAPPNRYSVYLGGISMETSSLVVQVFKVYIHPSAYKDKSVDIALLELEKPVTFTDNIKPVRLPMNEDDVYVGELATVAGTGQIDKGKSTDELQYVNVKILSYEKCQQFGDFKPFHLCTGGIKSPSQGACAGDSGSGMILRRPDGDTLIGIVSFRIGGSCGRLATSGYIRVNYFLDWIGEITNLAI